MLAASSEGMRRLDPIYAFSSSVVIVILGLKAASKANNLDVASTLLSQLKVLLTKFPSLPPLFQQTPNAVEELKLAREIYEQAVILSVKMEDQDAFERDFCQLKPYYMDTCWQIKLNEKGYDYLSINDAKQMFMFSSDKELQQYIAEEHPEWDVKGGRVLLQKAKESQPCKEIPAAPVINQTLGYARELERIV
ncbi:26S proteasome non-ATPase regulatory subunit 8 homolog A [Triticum aestivum]|uniref:26S proteasome non-ATPase regulatory subunit 8 homolog A n=1 Tax=Triticum aestivum TaxID=4565 RepID=UPI001D030781|nr:26S proteasome non-ATPase regulatory subunit 8 homolog A-like [Triticum aestivum]